MSLVIILAGVTTLGALLYLLVEPLLRARRPPGFAASAPASQPRTVLVPGSRTAKRSAILRHPAAAIDGPLRFDPSFNPSGLASSSTSSSSSSGNGNKKKAVNTSEPEQTMHSSFSEALEKFADRRCLGRRIGSGPYDWMDYATVARLRHELGSALIQLGLSRGDKVAVYSANCPEWIIAAAAASSQSLVVVPLYDTLGTDAAQGIVEETGARTILCSRKHLERSVDIANECNSTVQAVILLEDEILPEDSAKVARLGEAGKSEKIFQEKLKQAEFQEEKDLDHVDLTSPCKDGRRRRSPKPQRIRATKVQFLCVEDAYRLGAANLRDFDPPAPDDLATICFTSGIAGVPRGAELTHRNMVSVIRSAALSGIKLYPSDVHISYIPLAHMFERLVVGVVLAAGASVGFFRGDIKLLLDDVAELRPTIFPSVPRVFTRIHERVLSRVESSSPLVRFMFNLAMRIKSSAIAKDSTLVVNRLFDFLVFRNVRARLGGRVRLMMTGSAPISASVLNNLRCMFSAVVVEGYGLTETSAGCTLTWPGDVRTPGNVGGPIACAEVQLETIEEMGYNATTDETPRGEVLVRGPGVFLGYYGKPEITAEVKTEDGWMRTGDVGMLNKDGTLSLIDRRKALFKLAQGEYIAPRKIEKIVSLSEPVAQVFCDGDSTMNAVVAVAVLDADVAPGWLRDRDVDPWDRKAVADAILADFDRLSVEGGLNSLERIRAVHVEDPSGQFTPENGLLTATMMIKRHALRKRYKNEMAELYRTLAQK